MTRSIALIGTALALGLAGPAAAQSGMGGVDPATMTCADLTAMEEGRQEGAVYFVAGFQRGGMGGISGATGTSAGGASTDATTGSAATTGSTGAATGTDTTASTGTTTGTTTGSGSAGSDSATGGASMMASVDFDSISVDQILSACADSPDRMVSDILGEQSGASQ